MEKEIKKMKNFIGLAGLMLFITGIIGVIAYSGNAPLDMISTMIKVSNTTLIIGSLSLILAGVSSK